MSHAAEKLKAALLELPVAERLEIADFLYSRLPPALGLMSEGDVDFDATL